MQLLITASERTFSLRGTSSTHLWTALPFTRGDHRNGMDVHRRVQEFLDGKTKEKSENARCALLSQTFFLFGDFRDIIIKK